MKPVLLRSIADLAPLLTTCLAYAKARDLVEIGVGKGRMSRCLAEYCEEFDGSLTAIDPRPSDEFTNWMREQRRVRHIAKPSLTAIADVGAADAWVIDGDHNYYTVYNELRQILAKSHEAQKPLLVFLHDIGWPHGRRDCYADPAFIPRDFRHPNAYGLGLVPGKKRARLGRGLRLERAVAIALDEGGAQNGVLSAAEDFCSYAQGRGDTIMMVQVPAMLGLAVIFDAEAHWAQELSAYLLPYHLNPIIAAMESDRVASHIARIALQDQLRTRG